VMKARKTATRTCIACRVSDDKRGFVRVVRTPDGHVVVDPTGKANGRGAYLHATPECFETALKVSLKDDDYLRLRRDFDELRDSVARSQAGR
jgi:predicted RNA-binding protein YlxR (DUF448 family)